MCHKLRNLTFSFTSEVIKEKENGREKKGRSYRRRREVGAKKNPVLSELLRISF